MNPYENLPPSVRTYRQTEIVDAFRFPVDRAFDVELFQRDLNTAEWPRFDKRENVLIEHFQKGKVSVEPGQWILLDQSTHERCWNLDNDYFLDNYKRTDKGWEKPHLVQAAMVTRENATELFDWSGKYYIPPIVDGKPWKLNPWRDQAREVFYGDFLVKNHQGIVWPVLARVFAHSHVLADVKSAATNREDKSDG